MSWTTRQVYNLFQEPVEQPPLGFSIAEEKNMLNAIANVFKFFFNVLEECFAF